MVAKPKPNWSIHGGSNLSDFLWKRKPIDEAEILFPSLLSEVLFPAASVFSPAKPNWSIQLFHGGSSISPNTHLVPASNCGSSGFIIFFFSTPSSGISLYQNPTLYTFGHQFGKENGINISYLLLQLCLKVKKQI